MMFPSVDEVEKNIESKYQLTILAAKRARQIREGADPLIETPSTNPLTVALEEIASGKVKAIEVPVEAQQPVVEQISTASLAAEDLLSLDDLEEGSEPDLEDAGDTLEEAENLAFPAIEETGDEEESQEDEPGLAPDNENEEEDD